LKIIFEDLRTTLLNLREKAPELGNMRRDVHQTGVLELLRKIMMLSKFKLNGILVDEVTEPLGDGSKGSGLYKIPVTN
jgi:hypothetical protein